MEHLPTPLFCLTLSHSIDDVDVVERLLAEYPEETQRCIPIALRTILEAKDLPPVPFFSTHELLEHLKILWLRGHPVHKLKSASRAGLTYLVSYFINRGISTRTLNDALKTSAEYGHIDTVKLLLDKGANIHHDNNTPLRIAAYQGHIDTIKLLLDRKADVHTGSELPLNIAFQRDDLDMAKLLLDRGADINTNNGGLLQYAKIRQTSKLAQFLHEKGLI